MYIKVNKKEQKKVLPKKNAASCIARVGNTKHIPRQTNVLILGSILDMMGYLKDSSTPSCCPLVVSVVRLLPIYLSNILSANRPPSGVPMTPANAAAISNQYAASLSSSYSCNASVNDAPKVPSDATTPIIAAQPKDNVTSTGDERQTFISEKSVN